MKETHKNLWFGDTGFEYEGTEPFFYDTPDFPWVKRIESQWEVIRDELMEQLAQSESRMLPYANAEMTSKPNQWKTMGLMFWNQKNHPNMKLFPNTVKILQDIPNLSAISFNSLEPNTSIVPHIGNTNAIIRCHLGLVIPSAAPQCGFRVGNETRSWENGKLLMFCDAHLHTAWNNTSQKRYILVIDVFKDEYADSATSISTTVLSGIYTVVAYQKYQWLKRYFSGKYSKRFVSRLIWIYYRLGF